MNRSMFIILVLLLLVSCYARKQKAGDNITRVKLHIRTPIKFSDKEAGIFLTDIFANYYDDCIMYELPHHETGSTNEVTDYDTVRYTYFIYRADSTWGYEVDNMRMSFDKAILIDSSIKQRAQIGLDLEQLLKAISIRKQDKVESDSAEIYTYYFADSLYDSAHFYYDKRVKKIPTTLSAPLDSIHKSKLVKMDLYARPDSATVIRKLKDFHITSYSIAEVPVENEKEVKSFFQRFKRKQGIGNKARN